MRNEYFAWLVVHGTELCAEYGGKWIAVRGGKVVGVGETAPEAADQARREAEDTDFILEAIDADVIYAHP